MKSTDQATRCPACKTVFRVVADQLRVSEGWVRCGRCTHVFNATEHLMEMDRAWTRLADASPNVPTEATPEAAADTRPGPKPDAATRAASPDVWSGAPRATSHRAKQDDHDGHDNSRLATKIEAALSRSNGLPAGTQLPTDDGPPSSYLGPAWDTPNDDGWPTPAVAPLAFEPVDSVYGSGLFPGSVAVPPPAPDPSPTLSPIPSPPPAQTLAPAQPTAPPAAAPQAAPDPRSPYANPLPEAHANGPLADEPPGQPQRSDTDFSPDAHGHIAYADTEPALFGPQAEISATWHAQAWPQPGPAPAPLHDFHTDDRPEPRRWTAKPAAAKPGFLRKAEREQHWRRPHMRALLLAAFAAGVLALAAQVSLAYRDLLAARLPGTKPLLQALCSGLGCSVEAARSIESLAVENSGLVRVDKTALYKLQVTLRNRSNLELAVPALDVTFTDGKGELIARKVLLPQDLTSTIGVGSAGTGSAGAGRTEGSTRVLGAGKEVLLQGVLQSSAAVTEAVSGYTVELFYP